MKCTRCSHEITEEREKCPKCKEYTIIKTEGTVSSDPTTEQGPSGENYVLFTVQTADRELPFEIKQGFETRIPVSKGDEVIIEFQKFRERNETLRIRKLLNKTTDTLFNYSIGCLLPLVGILMVLITIIIF